MASELTNSAAPVTEQLTTIPCSKRERQRLLRKYPGVLAEVTRKLQTRRRRIDSGFVNRVFHRRGTSAKVYLAILDGFNRRIQAEHTAKQAGGNGA